MRLFLMVFKTGIHRHPKNHLPGLLQTRFPTFQRLETLLTKLG